MKTEKPALEPELDAIKAITEALATLTDFESQNRVLEFCSSRIYPNPRFRRVHHTMLQPPAPGDGELGAI